MRFFIPFMGVVLACLGVSLGRAEMAGSVALDLARVIVFDAENRRRELCEVHV